ncbi:LysR family transcriptional regulator [Sphingomonas koreensis]|nr:LysR family transcriptional regulator [Sphingomonas koreensis]
MMKLDGIAAFVCVADAGSISEAARRAGLAKSVVSERVAELERVLGARLVQRTTRKLSLSEDGLAFLERARRILREVDEATAEIAERRGTLKGPLRISGPVSFCALHLGPALYPFLAAHPGIDLILDLDDRFVDAAADGYDAVLRHGPLRDNRLIAKRLASSRRLLVASPAYLKKAGAPTSLDQLAEHRAILYANREADWRFGGQNGEIVIRPRAALRVNNGIVMRDAALAGLGITLLPTFLINEQLARGALDHVDIGLTAEGADLYLAYPSNRSPSAKVIALADCLRQAFGDPPYWDVR